MGLKMSKKSRPILYCKLPYKIGPNFLDILYVLSTECPRSSDPFYIDSKLLYKVGQDFLDILYDLSTEWPRGPDPYYLVSYYIKWVKNSWKYSMFYLPNV